jgi:hypothetical protein
LGTSRSSVGETEVLKGRGRPGQAILVMVASFIRELSGWISCNTIDDYVINERIRLFIEE